MHFSVVPSEAVTQDTNNVNNAKDNNNVSKLSPAVATYANRRQYATKNKSAYFNSMKVKFSMA